MSPDDVKALRTRLRATTKELAHALGIDAATLTAWERGEQFPTKRYVEQMAELDRKGEGAVPKLATRRGSASRADPLSSLSDPSVWLLIRKILVHAELRDAVSKLAERYDDPKPG